MGISIIDQELTRTTFAESADLEMTASGGVTTARPTYTRAPAKQASSAARS